MSEDTRLKELIINTLSPEQMPEVLSDTEIYLVEDDVEYTSIDEFNTHANNTTIHVTEQDKTTWNEKQDVITDLPTIRNNASTGANLAPQVAVNTQRIEDLTTAKFPNVVIIGTPHIEGGQVTNYSDTSYLQFPFVDISRGQPFDIYFSFTTSSDVTTQQNILDSYFGIALAIQNGKGIMALSSNGTNWDIGTSTGTNTLLPNTTYYVKYSWTGTEYNASLSTNDQSYVPDMNLTSSLSPHKTTIFIGGSPNLFGPFTAHPFKGTINFNKSKVVVNGITVWEGMADVGLASRANVSLNNLDEVGEGRFSNLQTAIDTKANESDLTAHTSNGTIHVTASDKIAWSQKQNTSDNDLTTTNKTIVGAINELNAKPSAPSIDNKTINQNTDNELQAIGIIDNNTSNAIKTWTGTKDEYEALKGKGTAYYAWSSLSGTYDYIYTLKEMPSVEDDIYYNNEVIGTVVGVPSNTSIRTSTASVCNRATSRDIIPTETIDNNTLYNVKNYGLFLGKEKISTTGGGLEVCDIGQALFVDESKGLRRYLNGSTVAINTNTQGFLDRLKAIISLYPSLATTEENWQAERTLSKFGQCGKFVIDEVAGTIRLPRIVMPIQGLTDLSKLGEMVEQSLPNIIGESNLTSGNGIVKTAGETTGAFTKGTSYSSGASGASGTAYGLKLDASAYSSIYKDGANVQQEQIQYPYFIQIATGQETQVDIINEIELNNPYSFGDCKYTEIELNNLSWLRSQGQWNSKSVYVDYYNWILANANGNVDKFKKSIDTYTDYDWVVDTANETFRLPIESNLASGKAVVGNGMTLGVTNESGNYGIAGADTGLSGYSGNYGTPLGTARTGTRQDGATGSFGITTDGTKSGIETDSTGLYLYYYVGETVQNANLIDAGRIMETMATKEFATFAGFPSHTSIDLELGASGTSYIAPANGYVFLRKIAGGTDKHITISGRIGTIIYSNSSADVLRTWLPVKKGDSFTVSYTATGETGRFAYIYAEGEE